MGNINSTIYNNIKALCKMNGLKMLELEKELGVKQGYFSTKKETTSSMPVSLLLQCANIFNVDLNSLCSYDYATQYEIEKLKATISEREQELVTLKKQLKKMEG